MKPRTLAARRDKALKEGMELVKNGCSYQEASKAVHIPSATLFRAVSAVKLNRPLQKAGRRPDLLPTEEAAIRENAEIGWACAEDRDGL